MLARKRPTTLQAEYRQRRAFGRPQAVPPDLFKRDREHAELAATSSSEALQSSASGTALHSLSSATIAASSTTTVLTSSEELLNASALAVFVTKSTDKKTDKYERFLRKLESRAVKTDVIADQLGIVRKKVTARTSIFFRSQVEKPVFTKPTASEERVYHYAVAAIIQTLEPSTNLSVIEASTRRWQSWLLSGASTTASGKGSNAPPNTSRSLDDVSTWPTPTGTPHSMGGSNSLSRPGHPSFSDHPDSHSTEISNTDEYGRLLENSSRRSSSDGIELHARSTSERDPVDDDSILDDLHHQSRLGSGSRDVLSPESWATTGLDDEVDESHYGASRSHSSALKVDLDEPSLADILSQATNSSLNVSTPSLSPTSTSPNSALFQHQSFSARRLAQEMAELGIAAGNLRTSLAKAYKEWELLITLQKIFQMDPELNKRIIAHERKRSSNEEVLLFDFSLRVAALSAHPIYTGDSFLSAAAYRTWMQRELVEVAHRTSALNAKDQVSLADTKQALLARRESTFVGKLHVEILGIGESAQKELLSEFGVKDAPDFPWNDVDNVMQIDHPASQIRVDLVSFDGIGFPFLFTTMLSDPSSTIVPAHEVMGTVSLPMHELATHREGVIITTVPLDQRWAPQVRIPVVLRIFFRWQKDSFYSITDHYSVYQYLSRRAMDNDIHQGIVGLPFPSVSVAELLERYGQRHGVRLSFRLISDFEILCEKLVDTGELELPVILAAADRLVRALNNDGQNVNTVERNILGRSLEQLRSHLVNRLEKYRECFPTTQPKSSCKHAISLLRQVVLLQQILDGDAHTSHIFQDILRDCIRANGAYMLHMMEGLTEEQRSFGKADAIKLMAEFILPELVADERFYTDAFPIPVLQLSATMLFRGVTQVIMAFLPNYEFAYTHSISWFRGYRALKWLNDRFGSFVDRTVVEPFPLDKWYNPSLVVWLAMLNTHVHEFVQNGGIDHWTVTAPHRLHSDHVLELFYWLESVIGFLHNFVWAKPETASDILTRFAETVSAEVSLLGVRTLDFSMKHKIQDTNEKTTSWRPTWSLSKDSAYSANMERKLAAASLDRKLCVLLNNIGLSQRWVEKLESSTMALLDVQLKQTEPGLRTSYLPSDYPIEQLYRSCETSLRDVLDQLVLRVMRPLRDAMSKDAPELVARVQKIRQMMKIDISSAGRSTHEIVDVDTELAKAVDPLISHIGAFIEACALTLYDRVFATMQLRAFEILMDQFSLIVHSDAFRTCVQDDPLLGTYIVRCLEMIKMFFSEGESALSLLHIDQASHDIIHFVKTGILPPPVPSSSTATPIKAPFDTV